MYVRRIRSNNQRWNLVFQRFNHYVSSGYRTYSPTQTSIVTQIPWGCNSLGSVIGRALLDTSKSIQTASQQGNITLLRSSPASWRWTHFRYFSSKGDGRDASEDKHVHTRDGASFDKGTVWKGKSSQDVSHCDAHTQLGEQEQKEWLRNEKLSIESKKKESLFLSRRERFKNEFLRRVVPWEKIALSWDTFPYYIHEHTKNVLMECVASHLMHKKVTVAYGGRLSSSSGRIMLQSIPGTELYRERLVRTLARDLEVPLLVLDSSILAPYDFGEDCSSESESDVESGEECTSDSEIEDANDASNEEEWTSSAETKSEASEEDVDVEASVEALEKLIPFNLEGFEKRVSGELESSSESTPDAVDQSEKSQRPFKKELWQNKSFREWRWKKIRVSLQLWNPVIDVYQQHKNPTPSYWMCTSNTKIQHHLDRALVGAVITLVSPYLQRDPESVWSWVSTEDGTDLKNHLKWARIQKIEDGCNCPNEVFIERARIEFVIPIWVEKSVRFLSSLEMEGNSERSKGLKNPLDLCVTH